MTQIASSLLPFYELFETMKAVNDRYKLNINKDTVSVLTIDPANVIMMNAEFTLPITYPELDNLNLNIAEEYIRTFDIFPPILSDEGIIDIDELKNSITISRGVVCDEIFLPTEIQPRKTPIIPKLTYNIQAHINPTILTNLLKLANCYGDYIRFDYKAQQKEITLSAENTGPGTATKTIGKITDDQGSIDRILGTKDSYANYSLDFLIPIMNTMKITKPKFVCMEYSTNHPLRLLWHSSGGVSFSLIAAPRIESE